MPVHLKNPKKYDLFTRLFLTHGEEFASRLPFLTLSLSVVCALILIRKGISPDVEIALGLLIFANLAGLAIGNALAIQMRFRRAEHLRLIQHVESLRQYTIKNFEWTEKHFADIGEVIFPPPAEVPEATQEDLNYKPLGTRERNTLLALIGVLCKESGIDWKRPAAAAATIKTAAEDMGVRIGESTIEEHLKKVPSALEARSY